MSTIQNGTRVSATSQLTVTTATRTLDRSYTRDVGVTPNVTGAFVFVTAPPTITLAGQMSSFLANNEILVEGTNGNNGLFYVLSVDPGGNFITVSPPPAAESPVSATIRAA